MTSSGNLGGVEDPARDQTGDIPFDQVPAAPADAQADSHYLEMRGATPLPRTYLPPAMAGKQPGWIRGVALVVIAMFLGATAAGVCLTYGPPVFG